MRSQFCELTGKNRNATASGHWKPRPGKMLASPRIPNKHRNNSKSDLTSERLSRKRQERMGDLGLRHEGHLDLEVTFTTLLQATVTAVRSYHTKRTLCIPSFAAEYVKYCIPTLRIPRNKNLPQSSGH